MVDNEDKSPISLPGNEFEKAAAEVSRDAGKSLIRGLENLFGARFAKWIAENHAKAEAARIAIETNTAIEQAKAITTERRNQELQEIRHQEEMLLAQRRLERLKIELAREQANFEKITLRSLLLLERDPQADGPREIDEDWLFRFTKYAQDVSDEDVQDLWARILSSAAIEGRTLLSPAALQIMSLIDRRTAIDFENFIKVLATFGLYPVPDKESFANEVQDIDLLNLKELGLIDQTAPNKFSFRGFDIQSGDLRTQRLSYLHTHFVLTQRGAEIANAIFSTREMTISDDTQDRYLQRLISLQLKQFSSISISSNASEKPFLFIVHSQPRSAGKAPIKISEAQFSDLLKRLLSWADENYAVERLS